MNQKIKSRRLRLESLEDRRLLAVTAAEYAALCADYTEFNLPEKMTDVNIIEIGTPTLTSIKAALTTAAQTKANDLIVVRTTAEANTVKYTGASNLITLNFDAKSVGSITMIALGDAPLTLNANSKCQVLVSSNSSANVQLGNITFTGGVVTGNGGALNNSGTMTLKNCSVANNTAAMAGMAGGGGVYTTGTFNAFQSSFTSNTLTGTTISGLGGYALGGGVCCFDGSAVFDGCVFSGNKITGTAKSFGAGLACGYATVTVANSSAFGNSSTSSDYNIGGGFGNAYGTMNIDSCVVYNNVLSGSTYCLGGGICNGTTMTINNTLVYGNKALFGAGIGNNLSLKIYNSTITSNASTTGGGLWVYGTSAASSVTYLYNSIVADNVVTTGNKDVYYQGNYNKTYAYNTLSSYTNWTDGQDNPVYAAADPLFTNKAAFDFTLVEGAVAVDAGNNANVKAGTTADLAGNARIANQIVDLGAYEFQAKPTFAVTVNNYEGIFDGAAHTISLSDLEEGDTVTYSLDQETWTADAPVFTDAGEYTVYVTVAREGYKDWTGSGTVAISAKVVRTLWNNLDAEYRYNAEDQGANITASYKDLNGESHTLDVIFGGTGETFLNAGSYTVTAVIADSNYQLTQTVKTIRMNEALVTVSITANDKSFDATTRTTGNYTLSGVYGADVVSLKGGRYNFSDINVGENKTVTFSDYVINDLSSNYALANTEATATASILPGVRYYKVTWTLAESYVYNGEDQGAQVIATYTDLNGVTRTLTVNFQGRTQASRGQTVFMNQGVYMATATTTEEGVALTSKTVRLVMEDGDLIVEECGLDVDLSWLDEQV